MSEELPVTSPESDSIVDNDQVQDELLDKVSGSDLLEVERAQNQAQIANLQAEKAVTDSENASLRFKNVIMQIHMKYKISTKDKIEQDGTIVRNVK